MEKNFIDIIAAAKMLERNCAVEEHREFYSPLWQKKQHLCTEIPKRSVCNELSYFLVHDDDGRTDVEGVQWRGPPLPS